MNISKEEVLRIIMSQPKGIQEKSFKSRFNNLYQELLKIKFPSDFKFSQKLYHYLHNDYELNLGKCIICGKKCTFNNFIKGYNQHCCISCAILDENTQNKMKQTNIKKFGVENPSQSEEIKKKKKETCLINHGVENPSQSEEIQQKKKDTCQKRYNKDYYQQTNEYKEKFKQSCLNNLGVKHPSQSEEIQQKKKQNYIINHGVENPMQLKEIQDKHKQSCLNNLGVENPSQSENVKEKRNQTNLEKFGVKYLFQSKEIKEKSEETKIKKYNNKNYNNRKKAEQTSYERYKVKNYAQTDEYKERAYNTKKLNNSFNSSKIEEEFKKYLNDNNIKYIYQYKSDIYPYKCDFYLIDYDLYIEIQGSWTHGWKPFDLESSDCIYQLNKWKLKSKTSNYYKHAINTWTISDVKKRNIAKENNLNYLEVFSNNLEIIIEQLNIKLKELE